MEEKQKEELEFFPEQPISIEELKKRIKSLDADLLAIEARENKMCYGSGCKNEVTHGPNMGNCGGGHCPPEDSCQTCKHRTGTKCRKLDEYIETDDWCANFKKSKGEQNDRQTENAL